jgi:L-ascorbate metabolism protein UlaG (beta-lactamase superfamily)
LDITYLGHSAFRLRGKDVTIVTDPPPGSKIQADIVTLTRTDGKQPATDELGAATRLVAGPGEYEVADVLIAGVATATEPSVGALSTAYVFRFDDLAVCHLGGARAKLTPQQIEEIGNVDVLLVPVGGNGLLNAAAAAEVVHQLEPKLVIPMEYRIDGMAPEREPVDHFCREMGTKEFAAESKVSVTKNTLPSEVRVIVLESKRA